MMPKKTITSPSLIVIFDGARRWTEGTEKPMRDYKNPKDITIPPKQKAIMNIVCEAWDECHESKCTNCPDRPKKLMSVVECFSLKFSRKLMEVGYAPVVRCGRCVHFEEHKGAKYGVCLYLSEICDTPVHVTADDYCSHGEVDNHETLAD